MLEDNLTKNPDKKDYFGLVCFLHLLFKNISFETGFQLTRWTVEIGCHTLWKATVDKCSWNKIIKIYICIYIRKELTLFKASEIVIWKSITVNKIFVSNMLTEIDQKN